jgi:hypothetical protein
VIVPTSATTEPLSGFHHQGPIPHRWCVRPQAASARRLEPTDWASQELPYLNILTAATSPGTGKPSFDCSSSIQKASRDTKS